jgi:hypothetical protein
VLTTIHSGTACFAFPVTYRLVDSPFNSVSGPYTTDDFIPGFFTVDIPGTNSLADYANLPSADRAPNIVDFAFFDGVQTFTASAGPYSQALLFKFATDGSSNIIESDYLIQLALTANDIIAPGAGGGQAISGAFNSDPSGFGINVGEPPGVWTTVPEPSTVDLLIIATSIAFGRRRRAV